MNKIDFNHEQYKPMEILGRGGMGIVYRCHDRKMGNDVAVKVIGFSPNNDEVIRFHKEAKALAKLQHPNILGILHFGHSDDDSLFLVMELLTGRGLSELIESGIIPPFEDALSIFIQICDGLSHAHRKDVLHRDVKPSNIFIERTASGDIKTTITDFGLAKLLAEDQRQTKTGIALGTPAYMSPEQAAGKTVDERSDLYSVGCLMVEVLTGQKPFDAQTIPGLIMKQINEPPPRLNDLAPDRNYPEEMEQIIAKCLSKNPDERYSTTAQLRYDLMTLKENSVASYAQAASSGQSGVTALDDFLPIGIQQQSKPVNKTAIGATLLVILGVMGYFIFSKVNMAPVDKSKSPPVKKFNPFGSKNDDEYGDNLFQDKMPTYSKTDKTWVKCRLAGAGAALQGVVNNAIKTGKKPGTVPYYIDARDAQFTEEQLHSIASLELLGLRLDRSTITDKSLRDTVSKITSLTELQLSETKITDDGVKALHANNQLKSITLSATGVTDQTLTTLCEMKSLDFMGLMDCPNLTGTTFGALAKFRKPISISVGGSNIKHENLKLLENVQLYYLDAARLNLNDKDLAEIAKLRTLHGLILTGNRKITPKGLLQLSALKELTLLEILDCPMVTKKATDDLVRTLPKLVLQIRDPNPDD